MFSNLWKLKQETDAVDLEQVKIPFISDMKLVNISSWLFDICFFNGKHSTFQMVDGAIDENFKPHGFCYFVTTNDQIQFVGKHPMLNWIPFQIKG